MANRKKSNEIEEGLEKEFEEDEEETKSEYEEPEEKEDIETEEAEEQEELSEEESESAEEELSEEAEENGEEDEEKKKVFVHEVSDFGSRGSLESEVEETNENEGRNEGFEGFAPQMSVREIPPSTLVSAPSSNIEEEVGGITELSSSRERREQAARTPVADYTAGAYERNYWVGGDERRRETRDMEMSIMPIRPEKEIREAVDIGRDARRIDFSAWQRGMEAQDMRIKRAPREEEYVIDIRKASEETRLPFERKEKKREYRP